jgi:hypothetical protein
VFRPAEEAARTNIARQIALRVPHLHPRVLGWHDDKCIVTTWVHSQNIRLHTGQPLTLITKCRERLPSSSVAGHTRRTWTRDTCSRTLQWHRFQWSERFRSRANERSWDGSPVISRGLTTELDRAMPSLERYHICLGK